MPYDPRPVSQGGNRGLGELFGTQADGGKWRVIGVDTFDGSDWVEGDFSTKEEAIASADAKGAKFLKMHVYDPDGRHVHEAGEF